MPDSEAQAQSADIDATGDLDADTAAHRTWVVDVAEHTMRLDKMLAARIDAYSRSHLQALIALGHVWVDELAVTQPSRRVKVGQRVDVELVPTAQSQAFHAEPMPLVVVHEDDDVLVVDKPVGLVVHPAAGHWSGTLMNGVLAHHAGAFNLPRAGIVHRLDKDTSGLMVVAKNLQAMTALVRALAAHEVKREYLALAHGRPEALAFTVDAPVGRDPVSRVRMAVRNDGKPARTDVEVLATHGGVCALRCRLHTGRTHQIRVHLASLKMPLLADALYGGAPALGLARQALHAARLAFVHPQHQTPLAFESLPPPDFLEAWRHLVPGYNHGQL